MVADEQVVSGKPYGIVLGKFFKADTAVAIFVLISIGYIFVFGD